MSNFKEFIKKENIERRRAKMENVAEYLDNNIKTIIKIFFGLLFLFSLLFLLLAEPYQKYDTKITSVDMIAKSYVNNRDTTFSITFQSKEIGKLTIKLDKDKYAEYYSAYKKGTNDYLYTDYNGFYFICLFYAIFCVVCFFSSND